MSITNENYKYSFIKNLAGFSIATWISFIISLIASPISTRLLLPEELGKINIFSTYASLITSISYLGLDQAYARFYREPPNRWSNKNLLSFCFSTSLMFMILVSIITIFFWKKLSLDISGNENVLIIINLVIFATTSIIMRYLNLSYRMENRIKWYTIQAISHTLLTKLLYICSAFWIPKAEAAITVLTISNLLFVIFFMFLQYRNFDFKIPNNTVKDAVSNLISYSIPLVPIAIITWLNSSISNLLLRNLIGFDSIGVYSTGVGLASTINIIQTGFNAYWIPYTYSNYDKPESKRFWTIHKIIVCIMTLFGLIIILFQSPIFIIIGKNYRKAIEFFPFLLISPISYTISETTGLGINISKKTYWNLIVLVTSIFINTILCFVLIPIYGATGAAIASAFSAIFTLLLKTIIGEYYYKVIENYCFIIKSVSCLFIAAIANYVLKDDILIKHSVLLVIFIIACISFLNEIAYILLVIKNFLIDLKKRKSLN